MKIQTQPILGRFNPEIEYPEGSLFFLREDIKASSEAFVSMPPINWGVPFSIEKVAPPYVYVKLALQELGYNALETGRAADILQIIDTRIWPILLWSPYKSIATLIP